jgi:glutaminyl-tRNA synthetase
VRLYNPLFLNPAPDAANFAAEINPNSLEILSDSKVEASLAGMNTSEPMQFERQGYFCLDPDATSVRPVFNRTVGLRDTYARIAD